MGVGAQTTVDTEFFPRAKIFGVDNKEELLINENRIQSFLCDQTQSSHLLQIAGTLGGDFDLIVDDGSHETDHQIISAIALIPSLARGGWYAIEDVREPERIRGSLIHLNIKCDIHDFGKTSDNKLLTVHNL